MTWQSGGFVAKRGRACKKQDLTPTLSGATASQASSFGRWAVTNCEQDAIRSSDCCSVRSASGTLFVSKKDRISSARRRVTERGQRADDDRVADELPGLLLQLAPALADQFPGEIPRVVRRQQRGDEELRILRTHLGTENEVDGAAHERGIA